MVLKKMRFPAVTRASQHLIQQATWLQPLSGHVKPLRNDDTRYSGRDWWYYWEGLNMGDGDGFVMIR
jgi:hypothetical protein